MICCDELLTNTKNNDTFLGLRPTIMNQVDEKKKTALMKLLAIVGLLAVLVIGAWVAVKVVVMLPSAFSSLASLADGISSYQEEPEAIVVSTTDSVIASGDALDINWTTTNVPGIYYFSYSCTEGVSISVNAEGEELIRCDELFEVNDTTLSIRPESEKDRFSDIPVTISFIAENGSETETVKSITVVNASITPDAVPEVALTDPDDAVSEDDLEEAQPEPTETGATDTPQESPAPVAPTPPQYEIITQIPVSNPAGYTDLSIRHLGVGMLNDGQYVPVAEIDNDGTGAIQFEVKNIGTKTSNEWMFVAELPNGMKYESNDQTPLKPNERAILTIGFSANDLVGVKTFSVEVTTDQDRFTNNNSFEWAVAFSN